MIMCRIMVSRILALIVWAAVAASAAHWGLRWFVKPAAMPPGANAVSMTSTPRGDMIKLLSGPAPAPDAQQMPSQQSALAARVQLLGVVAPRGGSNGPGVALLVVDGKPARAFKTGYAVDGDLVVQAVSQQGVQIGPRGGATALSLELPLMQPAATGSLPPPGMEMSGGASGRPGMQPNGGAPYVAPGGYEAPESMPPPGAGGMAENPVEGTDPGAANAEAGNGNPNTRPPRTRLRRLAPPAQQEAM